MLFNGLAFWVFIPLFFVLYSTLRGNHRLLVSLIGSYVFYSWWDWRFLFLIITLTLSNYLLGMKIAATADTERRKYYLVTSVVISLGILGYFKYTNFFLDSFTKLLSLIGIEWHTGTLNIILPVGISFYTFQTMSYVIDVYKGKMPVENSLLRFSVFVAFFPQLVAGPIVRASTFIPQLYKDQPIEWDRMVRGATWIAWGFILKSVIADSLADIVDARFSNPGANTSLSLMIGVYFYAFQIYGDFAGYSLIAIGLAHMLGYDFGRNFNRPYFSESFSEFWRRWHISLSSWLRDYLYISLGGNRKGPHRTYANLMITMLLGGLWHGAAWTFVIWGFLHGLYLALQRIISPYYRTFLNVLRIPPAASKVFLIPFIFMLTCITWVFFRAASFDDAWLILHRIGEFNNMSFDAVAQKFLVVKGFLLVISLTIIEISSFFIDYDAIARAKPWLNGMFLVGCMIVISLFGTFGGNAFIYFQF